VFGIKKYGGIDNICSFVLQQKMPLKNIFFYIVK